MAELQQQEDVAVEVEACKAVYGDDCVVLDSSPPHLHLHIKPRTADVSSQQFVEAIIGIRASRQHPKELPHIDLLDSKGLDQQRQKHLMTSIKDKASELSSCSMLVALCEEAVEKLSAMNHPDGDCPLCLYPLVPEDGEDKSLPFMKLMSCFHCFHGECITRWWNWQQKESESKPGTSSTGNSQPSQVENQNDLPRVIEEGGANCPVCRKVFHASDFEHVLDLVGTHSTELSSNIGDANDDENLVQSESENLRRQKFEAILKLQKENSGIIEPKKNLVVVPGMFLPEPVSLPDQTSNSETNEQQQREPVASTGINYTTGGSAIRTGNEEHRSARRKPRSRNSRNQVGRWIRKENDGTAN